MLFPCFWLGLPFLGDLRLDACASFCSDLQLVELLVVGNQPSGDQQSEISCSMWQRMDALPNSNNWHKAGTDWKLEGLVLTRQGLRPESCIQFRCHTRVSRL